MRYLKSLFIFLIIIPIHGQGVNFNKGKSVNKNFYTEIHYKEVQGKIIIPVIIEEKTYHFLLDTGAPNLVTFDLFEKIKTKPIRSITVKDANNKKMKMQVVSLPLITIGEASFKNIPTIVSKNASNFIFDCFEIDGIIGSNLLRNTIVQFLPKEKLIKLSGNRERIHYSDNNAVKLYLHGKQSSPYIQIKVIGESSETELVLLDTGMKGFYDLSKSKYYGFKKKPIFLKIYEAEGVESIGLFGPSNKNKQFRLIVPKITINGAVFNNVGTITTSSNKSRIGSDILKYGNVIIDYKNEKFVFEPFQITNDLHDKWLGISPIIMNDKFVVGMIWDKKLENEISFGDTILSINGISYDNIDVCNLITKESIFKSKDTLDIEFKNSKSVIKKIKLIKEYPPLQF